MLSLRDEHIPGVFEVVVVACLLELVSCKMLRGARTGEGDGGVGGGRGLLGCCAFCKG